MEFNQLADKNHQKIARTCLFIQALSNEKNKKINNEQRKFSSFIYGLSTMFNDVSRI